MKKLLLFGLMMLGGTAMAQITQAPPVIHICDTDNDFSEVVDLTVNESVIPISPTGEYTFTYYLTQEDAENEINPIANPMAYTYMGNGTGVYVRVETNNGLDYEIQNQGIIMGFVPQADTAPNMIAYESPSDGVAQFDLTLQNPLINGNPGYQFKYYLSQADAAAGTAQLMPGLFTNTSNPQTVWVRVEDSATGCFNLTSFQVQVVDGVDAIINIPDANFLAAIIDQGYDLNSDGQIQASEANFIQALDVHSNNIADLTGVNFFPNQTYLNAIGNQITQVNIAGLQHLGELNLGSNQITSITLSDLPVLAVLSVRENDLEGLDVSGLPGLGELDLEGNANLEHLNVKNGVPGQISIMLGVVNTTDLEYLCADEDDIAPYYDILTTQYGMELYVSSYCTFAPSGNYNTLSGNVIFDANGNGCDATDATQSLIKLQISLNGVYLGSTFTNFSGAYSFPVTVEGVYTIAPQLENMSIFNITPAQADVAVTTIDNSNANQSFCIVPNGVHPDVEVVIAPVTNAQPGFDAQYIVTYRNKGNQMLSGAVTLNFDDARLDYVAADTAPATVAANALTWNYTSLLPFEYRYVLVTFNLNGPMETPAINNGDILPYSVAVTPSAGDETPADNNFVFNQTVTGSFDPNNIICLEGSNVSPAAIGEYLHYIVNFENTGTAPATFIVVKHEINPADYDVESLQVMGASHAVLTRVQGNKVEFYFDAINLGASDHGNILFKIRSKNTLQANESVLNKANIFFDYNFPIETNDAVTTFQLLSRGDFGQETISLYPNPTSGIVNIKSAAGIDKVELYDLQGRLLQVQQNGADTVDLSGRAKGIYFIKIATASGIKTEKIVLE